jgi:FtsP/CotA-like multicopper oxidase with cupredoxin domain
VFRALLIATLAFVVAPLWTLAQNAAGEACSRPLASGIVSEPADLRSRNGVLAVELNVRSQTLPSGQIRFCYLDGQGNESPTLRLNPGDLLILHVKNEIAPGQSREDGARTRDQTRSPQRGAEEYPCTQRNDMSAVSTNLHFHGLQIPSACHGDDVLRTSIGPGDPPYEYRIRIPLDQPSGLYWYHPHLHGFSKIQVLGGASGAIVIEGIEHANHEVVGLPERVFLIRDQDLMNPTAASHDLGVAAAPAIVLDRDGDAQNTGTGTGIPAKDLSINFVPVPYPDYPPATIQMRPGERQLWRIVNASSITYLNLQLLWNSVPQGVGVVALDGVPLNQNGLGGGDVVRVNHVGMAPGGRAEFIVEAPPTGASASLITRSVNTGPGGENDPTRIIATIATSRSAPEPRSSLSNTTSVQIRQDRLPWLGVVKPIRTRRLYFSEKLQDPKNPNGPTTFYLTVDGQIPAPFDPHSIVPNIVAHQGDVEDWIIENRSQELHDFHIHQVHFLMLEWFGVPINEPFLRDTINVPFWDGKTDQYPTVKLRMDFRGADTVGLFPYHCHLLEHEDGGMMGLIRILPFDLKTKHAP